MVDEMLRHASKTNEENHPHSLSFPGHIIEDILIVELRRFLVLYTLVFCRGWSYAHVLVGLIEEFCQDHCSMTLVFIILPGPSCCLISLESFCRKLVGHP